ncbi:GNAT family N-acetyltransferase [Halosolutus gelatinilyticus]|uniref:GNAT family N-acetyltransferase n=1 Tax=Halosolutus gelatinilyticus TaxID=2931975 RepID=UPI001FF681EF|nr:GNAT family N-acetyltransferase [Halosolutus gelatinilyticus]
MNAAPEIRRATRGDAAAIARCYRRAYATAVDFGYRTRLTDVDAETVASWLSDGLTFVAEDGGEVIGTVRLLGESVPTVERLAVVPDRQREGTATRLLDHVETLVGDRGGERLRLTTFADHPFLLEWYERRGYEPIDCSEESAFTFEFVLLEKPLDAAPDRTTNDRTALDRSRSDGSAST